MRRDRFEATGFTLLETLVVVAIVALVAVGIAGIFGTVGDTITRGKRVSELNRTAAQIQRVMGEDFRRMTRDGILVIRNEYANRGQNVSLFDPSLYDAEPRERARRIDEIMFFAASDGPDFVTMRRALHPDMVARSSTAQIYYGHGKEMPRPVRAVADRNNRYYRPMITEHNFYPSADFGVTAAGAGEKNPNEFASDWSLLRFVTLLVPPSASETAVAEQLASPPYSIPRVQLIDSRRQIALQPAAQSIFRGVADQRPAIPANAWGEPPTFRRGLDVRSPYPRLTSGIVDIATTSLNEIRATINTMDRMPNEFGGWQSDPFSEVYNPLALSDRALMQAWMLEAMPSDPQWFLPNRMRTRIRYASEPPLASIQDSQLAGNVQQREFERSYREADQEMLTSSIFVARCTEFIVEWSYGLVDQVPSSPTYKQLIWYGLPRYEDVDGNGVFNPGTDVVIAQPFTGVPARDVLPRFTGQSPGFYNPNDLYPTRQLINAGQQVPPIQPSAQTEVSLFGYFDPGPGLPPSVQLDSDDSSWNASARQDPSQVRPWLWPALIRVTMTIADRTDPTIEETYQVIFEVPNGGLKNR